MNMIITFLICQYKLLVLYSVEILNAYTVIVLLRKLQYFQNPELSKIKSFKKLVVLTVSCLNGQLTLNYCVINSCADPDIFVRGPGQTDKKSSDNVFFF